MEIRITCLFERLLHHRPGSNPRSGSGSISPSLLSYCPHLPHTTQTSAKVFFSRQQQIHSAAVALSSSQEPAISPKSRHARFSWQLVIGAHLATTTISRLPLSSLAETTVGDVAFIVRSDLRSRSRLGRRHCGWRCRPFRALPCKPHQLDLPSHHFPPPPRHSSPLQSPPEMPK